MSTVEEVAALSGDAKLEAYAKLTAEFVKAQNVASLKKVADAALREHNMVGKTVLQQWAEAIGTLPNDPLLEVAEYAMHKMAPPRDSGQENTQHAYLDADFLIRNHVSECYQADGYFKKAAFALSGAKKELTGVQLCERSIQIAMLFLGENATEYAWDHIKRAAVDIHDVTNPSLVLQYKAALAQTQDAQHKFLEAAKRYVELAQVEELADSEVLEALGKAVRCVVLAPAGPQRQRAMGLLYQDSRTEALPTFAILEAMYMGRFVSPAIAAEFESTLQTHHRKVRHEDGLTILAYAMIEHNVVAASNLYHNISFESLGKLLGVPPDRAESIATKMILEDRITGVVDQSEGVLEFSREAEELFAWDDQIQDICLAVNAVAESIVRRYPVFGS